jgi:hypothetical protein
LRLTEDRQRNRIAHESQTCQENANLGKVTVLTEKPWRLFFIITILASLPIVISFFAFTPTPEKRVEFYGEFLKDIGIIIGGIAIIGLVWELVGGEPLTREVRNLHGDIKLTAEDLKNVSEQSRNTASYIKETQLALENSERMMSNLSYLTRSAQEAGLTKVGASSSSLSFSRSEVADRISRAKSNIDICGFTLNLIRESASIQLALEDAAKRNVSVRVMLLAKNNPSLDTVTRAELRGGIYAIMQ